MSEFYSEMVIGISLAVMSFLLVMVQGLSHMLFRYLFSYDEVMARWAKPYGIPMSLKEQRDLADRLEKRRFLYGRPAPLKVRQVF